MLALLLACAAIDGDTIRCGRERIRLIGIDAPELAGHCRRGRVCVEGDGEASRRSLAARMEGWQITARRFGRDRYGRTLALVYAGGVNLSCWQVMRGQAQYVPRWDEGTEVSRCVKQVGSSLRK